AGGGGHACLLRNRTYYVRCRSTLAAPARRRNGRDGALLRGSRAGRARRRDDRHRCGTARKPGGRPAPGRRRRPDRRSGAGPPGGPGAHGSAFDVRTAPFRAAGHGAPPRTGGTAGRRRPPGPREHPSPRPPAGRGAGRARRDGLDLVDVDGATKRRRNGARAKQRALQDAIKALIVERGLAPGAALPPEFELMEGLDVSRHPLREAMKELEALAIVDIRHGHGTYVGSVSLSGLEAGLAFRSALSVHGDLADIRNLLEVREVLENGLVPR